MRKPRSPKTDKLKLRLGASGELAAPKEAVAFSSEYEAVFRFLLAIEATCPECVRGLAELASRENAAHSDLAEWGKRWRLDSTHWRDPQAEWRFTSAIDLVLSCWRGSLEHSDGYMLLHGRWVGRAPNARLVMDVLLEEGPKALPEGTWAPILWLATGDEAEIRRWRYHDAGGGQAGQPDPIRFKKEEGIEWVRSFLPHGKKASAHDLWQAWETAWIASGAKPSGGAGAPMVGDFEILARFQVGRASMNSIAANLVPAAPRKKVREALKRTASILGLQLRQPSRGGRPS